MAGWGGARQGAGRKLDPDTIEWRSWCRRQLKNKLVRRRILKNLQSTDPVIFGRTLQLMITTAHPAPTELSGVIDLQGSIRVLTGAAKFGVQI